MTRAENDRVRATGPAEVVARKSYGEHYHALELGAPGIASTVAPGQFVNVGCDPGRATILRRPFSIARLGPGGGGQPTTVEIVFDIRGSGTAFLAGLARGDRVDLLGPLGRGFSVPDEATNCLLVGGGIGAAPLFFLADHLLERGHRVDFVLGARRADLLLAPEEAERLATVCRLTTEDGSAGRVGRVTDVLAQTISDTGAGVVLACGPHAMLAAVERVATDEGVPVQMAVEEMMACGWGVCMTCVMPVRDAAGPDGYSYARSCTEGPVFGGGAVLWNGAPGPADAADLVPAGASPTHATLPEVPSEHPPPGN